MSAALSARGAFLFRKDVFMKKTKFIVAFLLVCVLSIGGAVVVFAGTSYEGEYMDLYIGDTVYTVPNVEGDYLFLKYGNTGLYYMFDSPNVIEVRRSDTGDTVVVGFKAMYQKSGEKWSVVQGANTNLGLQLALNLYACNIDLKDSSGTVVFSKTEVPVVVAARVLPEKVAGEVKTILTIAIGGLALLIGSMVLLPKLKIFLVG